MQVVQGIGGGGMATVVSILLSDIIPLRERGVWQGIVNIIFAAGSGSGAPLGMLPCPAEFEGINCGQGAFSLTVLVGDGMPAEFSVNADPDPHLRSFLAQAPLCLLAFISVAFALQLPPQEKSHWRTKLGRIDFVSAVLLVVAVLGLIFGLDRGANVAWSIPVTYVPIIISVIFFALFILVETKVAAEPFAPARIIFNWNLATCYLCNFFSMGGWMATIFYIPLFFQAVTGYSATGAGLRLIPPIVLSVSGSLCGGLVMRKTGRYKWLTVAAYSSPVVGSTVILLTSGIVCSSSWGIVIGMMVSSFGWSLVPLKVKNTV